MQLPTLTVTREQALEELARYRHARKTIVLTREDERMAAAYRAIAKGQSVIDLHRALEIGGTETRTVTGLTRWQKGMRVDIEMQITLPRLCAFRADKRWAWCDGVGRDGTVTFRDTARERPGSTRWQAAIGETRLQIVEAFSRNDARDVLGWGEPTFRALLPTIPPHLRPTRRYSGEIVQLPLRNYLVLWEAVWELDRTVPPGDPALLQHIGGSLYRVLAKWDLTPVEQAVLAGRRPTAAELGA